MEVGVAPLWEVVLGATNLGARLFVGLWILWRASRTRALPELVLGVAMTTLAIGEFGAILSARMRVSPDDPGVFGIAASTQLIAAAGHVALLVGVQQVFRRESRLAALGAGLCSVVLLTGWAGQCFVVGRPSALADLNAFNISLVLARAGSYLWWAVESLLYYATLRRRLKVGLTDALTTHRFLLWGISGVALSAAFLLMLGCNALLGRLPVDVPAVLVALGVLGLAATLGIWLSFLPSRRYRAHVLGGRADASGR